MIAFPLYTPLIFLQYFFVEKEWDHGGGRFKMFLVQGQFLPSNLKALEINLNPLHSILWTTDLNYEKLCSKKWKTNSPLSFCWYFAELEKCTYLVFFSGKILSVCRSDLPASPPAGTHSGTVYTWVPVKGLIRNFKCTSIFRMYD